MRNPRLTIRDAVTLARRAGIRVRRQHDGHWLFFFSGRVVSVNPQRSLAPPRLAVELRRRLTFPNG